MSKLISKNGRCNIYWFGHTKTKKSSFIGHFLFPMEIDPHVTFHNCAVEETDKVEMEEELAEVEENIYFPSHYSPSGCPIVPVAFSGMTGRQL